MWERNIITLARIQLFPLDHPAAIMCLLAETSHASNWYSMLCQEMASNAGGDPIPLIWSCGLFPRHLLNQARDDKTIRKNVLRKYKLEVVRPKLQHRDSVAFIRDANKCIFSLSVPFSALIPSVCVRLNELYDIDSHPAAWKHFRVWAFIRLCGKWPAQFYSHPIAVHYLSACPLCQEEDITVAHALFDCPCTSNLFSKWLPTHGPRSKLTRDMLVHLLFGATRRHQSMQPAIRYTYFAVHGILLLAFKYSPSPEDDLIERIDLFMSQSRVLEDSESDSV